MYGCFHHPCRSWVSCSAEFLLNTVAAETYACKGNRNLWWYRHLNALVIMLLVRKIPKMKFLLFTLLLTVSHRITAIKIIVAMATRTNVCWNHLVSCYICCSIIIQILCCSQYPISRLYFCDCIGNRQNWACCLGSSLLSLGF